MCLCMGILELEEKLLLVQIEKLPVLSNLCIRSMEVLIMEILDDEHSIIHENLLECLLR